MIGMSGSAREVWAQWWRGPGGGAEVLRVAWPLILANSFWTLQIALDRVLLSRAGESLLAAATASAFLFWTPMTLLHFTASYATTFVAQYTGAGQPRRVGASIWQALYFSLFTGLLFLFLLPLAPQVIALAGHDPQLQSLEVIYFRCLCFSALPTLLVASASSLFAGLGSTRTVLFVNAMSLVVNGICSYLLIFGKLGFPEWGIAGAGWGTVIGTGAGALLALALMFRQHHRRMHATLSAWSFDRALFLRLLRFGGPNGAVIALETLAWTLFLNMVGWLGEAELAASSAAFTLNLIAFLPMMGLGQAVGVLVGQRLGEDRPALAERSTWTGLFLGTAFTALAALAYVLLPRLMGAAFAVEGRVADLLPVLLRFVAVYAFFDSVNVIVSSALRGAGDVRFVSLVSLGLSWPILVVPAWLACSRGWGLGTAWVFATLYIVSLSVAFMLRFHQGKWKEMRVIEPRVVEEPQRLVPLVSVSDCGRVTPRL
jgi:MATE family, multidrug efflux pump